MVRLIVIALLLASPLAAEEWQPKKTWIFAVGILEYEAEISGWPEEGRVDAKMIQAYKDRGVPENQIVFLKNKDATKKAIDEGLGKHAKKAGEDDTFIFYYAGHGGRDYTVEERPVAIIPYDSKPGKAETNLLVARIFDVIEKNFVGTRVILTSDCCHSGGFVEVAKKRVKASEKISYAAITSAHVSSKSTGAWTYTECLLAMLTGDPLLDADNDKKISFGEVASHLEREMAFGEEQLSCSMTSGTFSKATVFAATGKAGKVGVGKRLEATDKGKWYRAKVLDSREGEYFVHWVGFAKSFDSWVKIKETRKYEPKATYKTGQIVSVEWGNRWYKAKIIKTHLGLHYVHYEGFTKTDDEWVPKKRIKPEAAKKD